MTTPDQKIDNGDLDKLFQALNAAEKLWNGAMDETQPLKACGVCGGKGQLAAGSLGVAAPCHACDGEGVVEDEFGENPITMPPELTAARTEIRLLAAAYDDANRIEAMSRNLNIPEAERPSPKDAADAKARVGSKEDAAKALAAIQSLPDPRPLVRQHRAQLAAAGATPKAQLEAGRPRRARDEDPVDLADRELDQLIDEG